AAPPAGTGATAGGLAPGSVTANTPGTFIDTGRPIGSPVLTATEPLPETTPGLIAELTQRNKELDGLIGRRDLGPVSLPAIRAKDVARALERHGEDLKNPVQRAAAAAAIKQLVVAAWQIDASGDLGDKSKIADAYVSFAEAVGHITDAYAVR